MNIFILNKDPEIAAQLQVDKHVVKMILETAQLLSTAHRVLESPFAEAVYKKTHINHPCSIWARYSKENYDWLYKHFLALIKEYTYRYEKVHASSRLIEVLKHNPVEESLGLTAFPLAMPEEYKTECPVQSYKNYYIKEKSHIFSWKKRSVPEWAIKI